ncbi:MAG: 2-oxoacid:acceptor oxidoreductase subunit alpha [Candidatus Marsarchaeota archaeon]|jgi:2-oxoglutarate ferredoxin oxidoreductase subunit alpha|nr:2-oxoacid:acceptor oxidoreductase subunit alpha [Candidatus Marsarchaeota archaeon]MCL5419020.1 2-oxoacid:acceptor oxidoreductase subunit alpha [Candidatus Marsarchaeota archaeon]
MSEVVIRVAGANGDGIESSGMLLLKIAARSGRYVFGYRSYQSVIKGGHVWYQIRIADEKLYSHGSDIDILVALDQDAITYQLKHVKEGGIVIYDPSRTTISGAPQDTKLIGIPLLDIATKVSGDPIMRNTVALGAVLKLVGIDIAVADMLINETFSKKSQQIADQNIKAAAEGYNFAGVERTFDIKNDSRRRYVLDGNTALSVGAYAAGCKFYAAYPMTPASSILHWFASHENLGVVFKQTEDEITAINATIGAASAGVRAMCGTSGGGFSLMVEALGLAGMIEVPIVVVEAERTGPSTGLPTKTEQADLLFVNHAAQGEFPRIVVAPRSAEESFKIAYEAFNLAEMYQCPVIILSDLYMAEHIEGVEEIDVDGVKVERGRVQAEATNDGRFDRYKITDDGISPRSIPGTPGLEFVAASDEHNEYGDLISDVFAGIDEYVEKRKKMHEKRMRKIDTMLKNEDLFKPELEGGQADYFFVTFGSATMPAKEAVKLLSNEGLRFGIISFSYLLPIDAEKTLKILNGKKLIDVEYNFTGQLAQHIKSATGINIEKRILKYDGEAFTPKEIAEQAKLIANGW